MPKEYGKDPGEAYENGFDFAEWFYMVLLPNNTTPARPPIAPISDIANITTTEPVESEQPIQPLTQQSPPQEFEAALDLVDDLPPPEDPTEIARMGHFCIHGHYCGSAKDNICLKSKLNIFTMDTCPGGFWYRESHGPVDVVILGVNFKKRT
jgi:hypothetical protein